MKPFVFFVLLFLFGFSCKRELPASLEFGWGGGFVGKEYRYTLNRDGELKEKDKLVKKLPKKDLKEIAKLLRELPEKGFDHPYNTYSFIVLKTQDGTKKYLWGDPNFQEPEVVENLHQTLTQHLK